MPTSRMKTALAALRQGLFMTRAKKTQKKILDFFERKIAGKKLISEDRKKKKLRIEDYYALGPNCTTLTVDGIKTIFPDIDRDWSTFQKGRGLGIMEKGQSLREVGRSTFSCQQTYK